MMKRTNAVKKFFMKHLWRFQQSQAFVSILLWSLALSGIFYERSGWYFEQYFGLSSNPDEQVITKMAILMAMVILMVVFFGFLYDTIFRLWEQQNIVGMERNVFGQYKFNVKEIITMRMLYIPLLKSVNKGEYDEEIAFMERWIDKIMQDDAVAQMFYDHILEWIESDRVPWKAPTMEKLLAASREQLKGKPN